MRTITKSYHYTCDAQGWMSSCAAEEEVQTGHAIPAHVGALFPNLDGKVRTAKGADKVMKLRFRWLITDSVHLCPDHKEP